IGDFAIDFSGDRVLGQSGANCFRQVQSGSVVRKLARTPIGKPNMYHDLFSFLRDGYHPSSPRKSRKHPVTPGCLDLSIALSERQRSRGTNAAIGGTRVPLPRRCRTPCSAGRLPSAARLSLSGASLATRPAAAVARYTRAAVAAGREKIGRGVVREGEGGDDTARKGARRQVREGGEGTRRRAESVAPTKPSEAESIPQPTRSRLRRSCGSESALCNRLGLRSPCHSYREGVRVLAA